eukprot:COSAG05_NODE_11846_length_493_cov_1.218274_1_plen_57_part_10
MADMTAAQLTRAGILSKFVAATIGAPRRWIQKGHEKGLSDQQEAALVTPVDHRRCVP